MSVSSANCRHIHAAAAAAACYVDSTQCAITRPRRIIGGVEERLKRQTLEDVEIDEVEGTG
jgi:hypothetical protein